MKKTLISLSIIAAVAAIAIGATTAFFSDTETSTGNTFTAGNLDLKIDNECHYNGMVCAGNATNGYFWVDEDATVGNEVQTEAIKIGVSCACSWAAKDLTSGNRFYDYGDIKPGDWGEHTLSIYVDNNDAYARVLTTAIENRENGCTEPEGAVDTTCVGRWCGELAQNMYTFSWIDNGIDGSPGTSDSGEGDNIYQTEEVILTDPLCGLPTGSSDIRIIGPNGQMYCPILTPLLADYACTITGAGQGDLPSGATQISTVGLITGGKTHYIGTAWFVPYSVNNIIQGDSIKANISFEIEQARHNTNPFN